MLVEEKLTQPTVLDESNVNNCFGTRRLLSMALWRER
jgi:hypothetical protein